MKNKVESLGENIYLEEITLKNNKNTNLRKSESTTKAVA